MSTTISIIKNLQPTDINVVEFKAYKNWIIESGSTSHTVVSSCFKENMKFPSFINGGWTIPQSALYYASLNQSFYKNNNLMQCLGAFNTQTQRLLYQSASIFSFPRIKVGEGIKNKSFRLQSTSGSITYDLRSDLYGNVYDSQINTDNIISDTRFYEGFNQYFNKSIIAYDLIQENNEVIRTDRYISGSIINSNSYITFVPGVLSTENTPIGYAAQFEGTGSFVVSETTLNGSYNKDDDYAVSMFISASDTNTRRSVVCKHGSRIPLHVTVEANGQVGFYVYPTNSAKEGYFVNTAQTKLFVTSSTCVTSSWNHVVCQKSGSYLQVLVNGSLESSKLFTQLSASLLSPGVSGINSPGNLYMGGWPTLESVNYNFVGKLDEVRLYNKTLTTTECGYLNDVSETGTMLQTNIVGNVFGKHGIATITSPNYIYHNILETPYLITYKSTVTRYEYSTLIRIKGSEFNASSNNSLVDASGKKMISDISQSDNFSPYITTIGLYDTTGNLVMIGKLGQPIKKRSDVDLNILMRLDLDTKINTQPIK
jgi:hypothetical protein